MRARTALVAALLLVSTSLTFQVMAAEDLYWEGEEDTSNEFLEVKDEDTGITGHLKRLKRGFWDFWDTSTTTASPETNSVVETDQAPDDTEQTVNENLDGFGSGSSDLPEDSDTKEKTLRVTFVVNQPYSSEYSNRDSQQFKSFSSALANAVNELFDSLPGTQRASLVRIQSRVSDEFTCKVTLDIVTTGYDDTDRIGSILRDHIHNTRRLKNIAVDDVDFSTSVIDSGLYVCAVDEIPCDDGRCLNRSARCNGLPECSDGSDEAGCPSVTEREPELLDTTPAEFLPTDRQQARGDDWGPDNGFWTVDTNETTTLSPREFSCPDDELRCDETRCVPLSRRCDGVNDCYDNTDEAECEETCGGDDFRCDNGKCIESSRRCDRIVDCPTQEDEKNCECRSDEFRCPEDGSCIEARKHCDGVGHCPDNYDEINCACSSDQWQCDHGNCIKRSKRCDGRVDCPTDRSDERNCFANGFFRCSSGTIIANSLRCNRRYDCPRGDYSDEHNCPCGEDDFRCDNNYCIPAYKHCDRTHDCQDRSDERNCTYGTICMAYEYKCTSGQCVRADAVCNGTVECYDSSDERNCPCKRDSFMCRDGSCINIAKRCNARRDCLPYGEDEIDCQDRDCPPDSFKCDSSSATRCATHCDGRAECDDGEDEDNCEECNHECDGRCLRDNQICDNVQDCRDGSDELHCDDCDGPTDFRCNSGECLNSAQRCNHISECADNSDERDCNGTVSSSPSCLEDQFQCRVGTCIDITFLCDRNSDCIDGSDEENCVCGSDEFQCRSGQCLPGYVQCDGMPQCNDGSDEENCIPFTTTRRYPPPLQPPFTTTPQTYDIYSTPSPFTSRPYPESTDPCKRNEWRCENGPCIQSYRRCDGRIDCPYGSDEYGCPGIVLNLKTYPEAQTVRNAQAGGDVVFQCRDEGPQRAPVRWVREGGRPLRPGSSDKNGRLEMYGVSVGDSGAYICQAPKYLGRPGSETRVQLLVDSTPVTQSPPQVACQAHQATCGNGQCIPRSAICDGNRDCSDGSDEDNCNQNGLCEPNQYQCANRKCVLKSWLCDYEDDCGDNSDEANCGSLVARTGECLTVEYRCSSGGQCVPKSFHCDGQRDCFDGSDEIGCAPVHVTKPPSPANIRLNPGDTLTLVCEAVGVPTPLISWRLNWGHVPANCTSTSERGVGVLTCYNMQPEHSGAYSCEAMNNKGTTFAAPDSIVHVNKTDVCPSGFFNSEARSENECIRCFCFGESTQCRSADLFTYNMPTPLGEGGTRLVGVKQAYNGEIQLDTQPITDQYYYQPLRNGATVTKLESYGPSWSFGSNGAHAYLTLPETYNGNQLTSYGGLIKYRLSPHSTRYSSDDGLPDIIIKGKYESLIHRHRGDKSRETTIEARLTPENWQKTGPRGLRPVTREDIMMALDNIDLILLRADLNNAGVNITDFAMESAQHINVGLGAANLVEECTCPAGYEGLSCQKCASGFVREKSGPWLGNCVREQPTCQPGTYGDPSSGYGCRPCPCPLTNPENQFARTCSIGPSGGVICDCAPGYGGQNCEYCERGYVGNPMIPGDSCRLRPTSNCNPIGTSRSPLPDECQCKDNVQGRYCDQCKNDSFYLSEDFRHGCALCFCSGVSQQCMSSNLRRKTTAARFNTPQLVEQVRIYHSAPLGPAGNVKYNAPVETDLRPALVRGEITVTEFDRSRPSIYYWSLPVSFAGDKVTSYGGHLTYTLKNIPAYSVPNSRNTAADVQLISENRLTFHYFGNFAPSTDGILNASVQFLEKGWQRPDGKEISREHFLLALADVKAILVKATYSTYEQFASLESATIETAEPTGNGPPALHVEQCVCPTGYVGTSCEDCAPGYTRSSSGLYLEHCGLCDCNGHSTSCHPETGVCYDCRDNTAGDNCEYCRAGYEKNPYGVCVPSYDTTPTVGCRCDPRGEATPCDARGYCECKQNVEGEYCDQCRPGTFGLDRDDPLGCLSCYCSGVTTDCHEAGHYARIEMAAPILGENYGGYTLIDLNGERVIKDQFLPDPNESELLYNFGFPPNEELYWSLPVFPGNRVLSYGGTLSLTQKFESGGYPGSSTRGNDVIFVGDDVSVYWTNPTTLRSGEALSYQVPIRENGWYILNTATPASRNEFMTVLKNLRRVLVRATLAPDVLTTAIADVSMDTAAESYNPLVPAAKGVEICMCPEGYFGTSCEDCSPGWYRDQSNTCRKCNCNGHECRLGNYNEVVCNCRPPYSGPDCATIGLVMELQPKIIDDGNPYSLYRNVTLTCKYRAPQPLTIKFYFAGREVASHKNYYESKRLRDGWHGEHVWRTTWDTRRYGEIYECHTVTAKGFTLGVLSTSLPESGGDSSVTTTNRPPPPEPTVYVRITSPTIKIQEIGSSVNFTCQAQSRVTSSLLPIQWVKVGGELPQGRSQVNSRTGLLLITNLQLSDSGKYICQTSDGVSTAQAIATLKVPGNEMTLPIVTLRPTTNEYYVGDRIVLECLAAGNPAPRITWQRASNYALPRSSEGVEGMFIIESAIEEDSGEYRCIASNAAGSTDRVAIITVRPRQTWTPPEKLTVSATTSNVNEGQSTRIVCTGTPSIPAGSIDWSRQDGVQFLPNVRSDQGVLYIDLAVPANQGVYTCQALSPDVAPVSVVLTVVATGTPPPGEAPSIEVSKDRVKIPTGGSDSVDCIPVGYPQPIVRWRKYDGEFGPNTSQRDNALIISNAQESDQGYYLCEGSVSGTVVANIYVSIEVEKREAPRVEIWPQGEQAVALGSQFEFHCRVTGGVPEPDITWDRNGGRPLSPDTHIQKNNVLRFEKIDVNDEGEYKCVATNVAGSSSASAVLKVRSPPEITITPGSFIEVANDDPINIECRANGFPEPLVSIRSYPDNRELVAQSPGIAVLRIPSASERDEGTYVCQASSAAATIEEQFVIRVDRNDRGDGGDRGDRGDGGDFFDGGGSGEGEFNPDNREPANLIAFVGDNRIIACNASNGFRVVWRRTDNRPLINAYQNASYLIIHNASKSDSGQYECIVINSQTNEIQQVAYTTLQVIAAPRITLQPKTQTVQPGQSPTVECIVDGDDIIQIVWRGNGRPPSRRVEMRGSSLIFHQIEVEDAGKYECFARNRHANASAVAEVIVSEENDRVPLESHENEQFAHVGAAVHLGCNVTQPSLRIRWTKNGRNVPRHLQKGDGTLFIRLAQKTDSGVYVCNIEDQYGRKTSNYINLHIQGECLDTEFQCYDHSDCIEEFRHCDGYSDCVDNSDEEYCRDKRLSELSAEYFYDGNCDGGVPGLCVECSPLRSVCRRGPDTAGSRYETPSLVTIDQPRRSFRVGENVEVRCTASSRGITVNWERYGNNQQRQYVDSRTYGDGSMLVITGVQEADAGVYRCSGSDSYGRTSYEDFNLEVIPVTINPNNPVNDRDVYTAQLGSTVDMPCRHDLEQPVFIEWRREYSPLPLEIRKDLPTIHLERVTEADAGTYVCRISNSRAAIEARAILRVEGVVPRFDGDSWLALPTIKDAYRQFDIEISFNPSYPDGLILYNSQLQGREGDYVALQLVNGVPEFSFDTSTGPITVKGDRPLQLNEWHTIRLSRTNSKVTMDVDNTGPFLGESSQWDVLDLFEPLYIGGVPDYNQLPEQLSRATGFMGCVSMLILGREEKNIMLDNIEQQNIKKCDTCSPNPCQNDGVCQEARSERGHICLCASGFAGQYCDRTGDACRPGLCGPGKCTDTTDGYKCACPVTYTGRNCDVKQQIEYPAFTGSAYLAIKAPQTSRFFTMSMNIKASSPVTDGIIMYCAESPRGRGGFTSLAVHDGKLEFRYDLGDGSTPVVITANQTLSPTWTNVHISRIGPAVSLKIGMLQVFEEKLERPQKVMRLETPLFVGGVDDSIILNNNTGVTGGFNGCIKDVMVYNENVDIVNSSIQSANVQECNNYERGDIPETESQRCSPSQCRNGGYCQPESTACSCPAGFTGLYCESRTPAPRRPVARDPCAAQPCRNGGVCKLDRTTRMNYSCDCPLGFAGANCQMTLQLLQSVGFNGNGYLELPSEKLRYDRVDVEPVVIALAFHTTSDGVLLYQREAVSPPNYGDYILLRVDQGRLVLDLDFGSGLTTLVIDDILVTDGERHEVIAKLNSASSVSLSVDRDHYKASQTSGLSNLMNADSNVYIGGIPERYNLQRFPGLTGCIEQVELMDSTRGLNLGEVAVAGRNTQICRDSRTY